MSAPQAQCSECGHPCEVEDRFCRQCGRKDPAAPSMETAATLLPTPASRAAAAEAAAAVVSAPLPKGGLNVGALFAGRYRIERLLGEGGMGRVWKATDETIEEPVALKVLSPVYASEPVVVEQFKRELKLARRVRQRNVVQSYDIGFSGGICFISMEYVDAESLAAFLRRHGPLPEAEALALLRQILKGLAAAHELGIVHRDIKAANVLVNEDRVAFITDFGIATPASLVPELDAGTPEYMAPEQFRGEAVVAATDLYACGVLLHTMLTGTMPFRGATSAELKAAHLCLAPEPLPESAASAPTRELESELLRKDPDERPRSAGVVLDRVNATLALRSLAVHSARPIALVVESDPAVLVLCALALEREGYHVLTAEDARQGLKLAFENDPAVIVVDAAIEGGRDLAPDAEPLVDLPGLGFARVLATDQKLRRVPVVVSAPPGEGVREALELAGVAGVLAEPITPEGLAAEVKRAMGSWLERTGY